jgi:dihydroflavonol-4-reductase
VDFDPAEPRALYELHVEGTRRLLDACVAAGVKRVVLASSSGTIAVSREERIATEADHHPIGVVAGWPYYLSKIYQEKTALRVHRESGLPVVVLNPSLLLGPGDARLSSTDVVFKFLERRVPAMPSGGLSFVDVRDAARAFAAALTRGRPGALPAWRCEHDVPRLLRPARAAHGRAGAARAAAVGRQRPGREAARETPRVARNRAAARSAVGRDG